MSRPPTAAVSCFVFGDLDIDLDIGLTTAGWNLCKTANFTRRPNGTRAQRASARSSRGFRRRDDGPSRLIRRVRRTSRTSVDRTHDVVPGRQMRRRVRRAKGRRDGQDRCTWRVRAAAVGDFSRSPGTRAANDALNASRGVGPRAITAIPSQTSGSSDDRHWYGTCRNGSRCVSCSPSGRR